MGHCCPLKCTPILSEQEHTITYWSFKLNSALATAQTERLKGHVFKVHVE